MFDEEDPFLREELRAAILVAWPLARQGGFFTPGVAQALRTRIDNALLLHAHGAGDALMPRYVPLPGEPAPDVGKAFGYVLGSVRWPALVRALPPLPRELDYAVWGRDLVLVDVGADLVVDVLPDALPDGAGPGVVYQ